MPNDNHHAFDPFLTADGSRKLTTPQLLDLACGRGFISLRSSPIHLRYGPHLRSRADLTQKNNPPPLQLTAHDTAETRFEDAFANRTDSDQWAYSSAL